jgi:hypothetical protein
VPAAARAECEDDGGGHGHGRRERGADAQAAPPRAPGREWRRRELGGQASVEAGRHVSGQRLLAEAGELQAHGLQLVVRHVLLEARVIHVR